MSGVVFDTGALIALDRGDRALIILTAEARKTNATVTIAAGCVAQAWRNPARQSRLSAFLRLPNVDIVAMNDEEARRVGLLLARTGGRDIVDAHVALCGRRLEQVVLTSDPEDLTAFWGDLKVRRV